MDYLQAQYFCNFPERLHPVSEMYMELFNLGKISPMVFLRYFSLPNSDYIEIGLCYIAMITGLPLSGIS